MKRVACIAAFLLGACGHEGESTIDAPAPPAVLHVLRGFELEDVERAVERGLFPGVVGWRSLDGGGPTTTASMATFLSGASPARHGVVSVHDHGAHHVSETVLPHTPMAFAEALGLQWRGGAAAAFGLPVETPDGGAGAVELRVVERDTSALLPPAADVVPDSGVWTRWFPAEDPELVGELGAELQARVAAAAAAGDSEALLESLGRRRGGVAHGRLLELGDDLCLAAAARRVEGFEAGDFEASDSRTDTSAALTEWVVLPPARSSDPSRAWVAVHADSRPGPVSALNEAARSFLASVAQRDTDVGRTWASDGRGAEDGEGAEAGFELRFGPGHLWEVEFEVSDASLEQVSITSGELLGQRTQSLTARVDTRSSEQIAELRIECSRRAAPARLSLRRDGRPLPRPDLLLGATDAARVPLPQLLRRGDEPWPEDEVALARVAAEGTTQRVLAEGLDLERSRAGSWPPSIAVAPIGATAGFERPRRPSRTALGLLIGDAVLPPERIAFEDRRSEVDALELVLPGGDDIALARWGEFGAFDSSPEAGQVQLRRLGPMFAASAQLDERGRRELDRLPEGW